MKTVFTLLYVTVLFLGFRANAQEFDQEQAKEKVIQGLVEIAQYKYGFAFTDNGPIRSVISISRPHPRTAEQTFYTLVATGEKSEHCWVFIADPETGRVGAVSGCFLDGSEVHPGYDVTMNLLPEIGGQLITRSWDEDFNLRLVDAMTEAGFAVSFKPQ